jgi:phosphatidylglycerophosphatase A
VFDVLKPEPARYLERVAGGWGIMLDDVAAGVYANLACRLLMALAALLSLPLP